MAKTEEGTRFAGNRTEYLLTQVPIDELTLDEAIDLNTELGNRKDEIRARQKEVAARLDELLAAESARTKFDELSDAEKAALRQELAPMGVESPKALKRG